MTTFLSVIKTGIQIKNQQLKCILCIWYLVKFKKGFIEVQILIHCGNEVNAMTSAYTSILKLRIYPIDIKT